MKKIFIFMLTCLALLGLTGCGCSRLENSNSKFYKKELSFDYDSMDTISSDIKEAIEKGIEDAVPVKMSNGHFNIEKDNYSYTYGEGTTKAKVSFYKFIIDARADESSAVVNFEGLITIDFENTVDGSEYGGNYVIKNKGHKEIEFKIDNLGKTIYDEKTGKFTIVIPELKETGTINQTVQSTTITKNGNEDVADPVPNTWDIDNTWDNVKISFAPHSDSK